MHFAPRRVATRSSTLAAFVALAACSSGGGAPTGSGSAAEGGQGGASASGSGDTGASGGGANGEANGATAAGTTSPSSAAGGASGALVFVSAGRLVRLDLATQEKVTVSLPYRTDHLGFNGVASRFTLVESPDLAVNTIHVTTFANGAFTDSTLPELDLARGFVSGAAQPSADGSRYAVITRENAALGDPFFDYLNVFDKGMTPVAKYQGFRDPQWATASIVVAASDDGVALVDVDKSRSGRVGPALSGVSQIALSPDAKSVAFVQASAVWRIELDGTGLKQVTRQDSTVGWPSWSPDGKSLAINRGVCSMTTEARIVIVPADGVQVDTAKAPTTGGYTCGRIAWQ